MMSIYDPQETKPSTAGGGLGKHPRDGGTGLAVVALGVAAYLFVELRDARTQIAALQARGGLASSSDKRTKELDLSLAAVRGQTATIAERTGVTEAELEKTAKAARQLREEQRKGQENLDDARRRGRQGEGRRGREQGGDRGRHRPSCSARSATSASRAGSSRATRTSSPL